MPASGKAPLYGTGGKWPRESGEEVPVWGGCCGGAKAKEADEAREGLTLDLWAVGSHGGA